MTPAMPPRMPVATPMAAQTRSVRVLRAAEDGTGQGYRAAPAAVRPDTKRGPTRQMSDRFAGNGLHLACRPPECKGCRASALLREAHLDAGERMLVQVAGDVGAVGGDRVAGLRGIREGLGCQLLSQTPALEGVVDLGVREPELSGAPVELGEAGERAVEMDLVT